MKKHGQLHPAAVGDMSIAVALDQLHAAEREYYASTVTDEGAKWKLRRAREKYERAMQAKP